METKARSMAVLVCFPALLLAIGVQSSSHPRAGRRSELGSQIARPYEKMNAPSSRTEHGMATVNGKLYLFGGKIADSDTDDGQELQDDLWRFEVGTGMWEYLEAH